MHSHATTHYFLQQDIYWILGEEETKKLPHHVKVVTPFEQSGYLDDSEGGMFIQYPR